MEFKVTLSKALLIIISYMFSGFSVHTALSEGASVELIIISVFSYFIGTVLLFRRKIEAK